MTNLKIFVSLLKNKRNETRKEKNMKNMKREKKEKRFGSDQCVRIEFGSGRVWN